MTPEEDILKKHLFPIADISSGPQLIDVTMGDREQLIELSIRIKEQLTTDHVCCPDASAVGLQDEFRNPSSPLRNLIADGFYRFVVIEASQGLNDCGDFQYDEIFLPYLKKTLFDVFDIESTEAFHPEQITQVLKDEKRSLFCFLDMVSIPFPVIQRLRSFTQEKHRILFCDLSSRRQEIQEPLQRAETTSLLPGSTIEVQLIVVQGKPEGMVIPIDGTEFKIGRGETCHLRPNSEQVSWEHAMFSLSHDTLSVRDLNSRNGTRVNGHVITSPKLLKDRDLVQVGPLTFAVAIQAVHSSSKITIDPKDAAYDDIESWLIADNPRPAPDRPEGVYGGDSFTFLVFKDVSIHKTSAKENEILDVVSDDEHERLKGDDAQTDESVPPCDTDDVQNAEFIDESNPFYVRRRKDSAAISSTPKNPTPYKDTSDTASDILRKMMERRKRPKSP